MADCGTAAFLQYSRLGAIQSLYSWRELRRSKHDDAVWPVMTLQESLAQIHEHVPSPACMHHFFDKTTFYGITVPFKLSKELCWPPNYGLLFLSNPEAVRITMQGLGQLQSESCMEDLHHTVRESATHTIRGINPSFINKKCSASQRSPELYVIFSVAFACT